MNIATQKAVTRKFVHFVYDTCLGFLVKVVGITMAVSVVVQILCRYLPLTPLRWTEELARFTFIWLCFLSAAMTLSRRGHLSIDFIYLKLGLRTRYVLDAGAWGLITVFSTAVALYGARLVRIVAIQKSPMLELSMSYFYAALPVCCFLCAMYGLLSLYFCLWGDNQAMVITD